MRAGLGGAAGLALAACSRSGDPARAAGPAPEPPVSAEPLPPAAVSPADPTASALPTPAPTPPTASMPVASATAPRAQPVHRLDEIMPAAPANAVALTIDDGPDDWYTPQVLKLLDRYGVQATFCVIGIYAAAFPELVSRIANAGHTICHHTMTHQQPFNRLSAGRLAEEIERPMPILEKATGIRPRLFRPPGGAWSPQIAEAVAASELTPIDWSIDPKDWTKPGSPTIITRMLAATAGDIVLCHDSGGDRSQTVRALGTVIPTLLQRGLTFVPLSVR